MKVEESCSCGASFKVEGVDAMKLVREWRRKHTCQDPTPDRESSIGTYLERTDSSSPGEFPIGFRYYPEEE
jgi:hypothetical protein